MEYFIKIIMKGDFPSGIDVVEYKVQKETFDEIDHLLLRGKYIPKGEMVE